MKNIFISSTFVDMQAERDMVQERVLPALRKEARKYGENVGVIDLRWGVDTSKLETEEGSAKVLKVCLDEIDRSHPYMLIFLGERYGTIADENQIKEVVHNRSDRYVTDDFFKSITALEIEYGALSQKYGELDNCIVCFREPVYHMIDDDHKSLYVEHVEKGKEKLKALKERIKKDLGAEERLITYSATWDKTAQKLVDFSVKGQPLETILTDCFIRMFQKDWIEYESLSWYEKEQLAFSALIESKLHSFVGRQALLEEYEQAINNSNNVVVLQGEVGSGKTSIMCKLIERFRFENKKVFSFFSGAGNYSGSTDALIKQMVYYLENLLGLEKHLSEIEKYDGWINYFRELCYRLPAEEKVYFFIDALDQLYQDEHVESLDFVETTKNVQMILSCTDAFSLPASILVKQAVKRVPTLDEADSRQVLEGLFESYSRNTYEAIEKEMLKKKGIKNALYISLLIQRLNMMDADELYYAKTEDDIVALATEIVRDMPDEAEDAVVFIINNAIHKVGDSEESLEEIIKYLAVSRNGLRLQDFKQILRGNEEKFSALDFSVLLKYLDSFFYIYQDDRNDFTHKVIRQGLLKMIEDKTKYERNIKNYLLTLEKEDSLRIQEGMYYARILSDLDFARQLFIQAYQEKDEDLVRSIRKDAIEDGGVFYSEIITCLKSELSEIKQFVQYELLKQFGLSQKEMQARITIAKAIVMNNEEGYKNNPREESLIELLDSYHFVSVALLENGEIDDALEYCEKALEYAKNQYSIKKNEQSIQHMVTSYSNIGHAIFLLGDKEKALEHNEYALKYAIEWHQIAQSEESLKELSLGYDHMGHALRAVNQSRDALSYYKMAQKYAEELCEKYDSEESTRILSIGYNGAGNAHKDLGEIEEALPCYDKALECRQKLARELGNEYTLNDVWSMYYNIGSALFALDKKEEALEYYTKMVQFAESLHEKVGSMASLRDLRISYQEMYLLLQSMNRLEEAQVFADKMTEFVE